MSCTSIKLKELVRDCDANVGGIRRVWLAIYQDNSFKIGKDSGSDDDVVTGITTTEEWYKFEFRKGAGSMTSTLNVDQTTGLNYISTELALTFSRMESAKRASMAALAVAETVGIVEDANGNFWALGVDGPVQASAGTGETGSARGDANQYTITMTDESSSWPYSISKEVVEQALTK